MTSPFSPAPGDPVRLSLALCHEVGNLLAAARLSAYLIARETEPGSIQSSAADVETIATQAGAALAHLRPLLEPHDGVRVRVAPAEVLRAVDRSLAMAAGGAPALTVRVDEEVPDVLADADALHHVLVTLALAAWDVAPREGGVRLAASLEGEDVVFAVEDDGTSYQPAKVDPKVGSRGRDLAFEVAATLVHRWRGRVHVHPCAQGTRVEVRLPSAVRPPS